MRPIVWMKSSTGIPLSSWTFLKTCCARSGFSCDAGWATANPAPISATRVICSNFRIQTSFLLMAARYRACIRSAHLLEEVLQRELHDPRVTGHENLSKVPAVQSENGIVWIQMVRHVERFSPELYGLPL